jgi:hypothetical protein
MYGGITAGGKAANVDDPLNTARRLVHGDFKKCGILFQLTWMEDQAAELIAKLIEQEIERAKNVQAD